MLLHNAKWMLLFVTVWGSMIVPKATVRVVDRLDPALAPAVVANVPIGLALFASLTSQVGDGLTRLRNVRASPRRAMTLCIVPCSFDRWMRTAGAAPPPADLLTVGLPLSVAHGASGAQSNGAGLDGYTGTDSRNIVAAGAVAGVKLFAMPTSQTIQSGMRRIVSPPS